MSRAPRSRSRHQRGFTLIELLVTLAITVIGLTGLMSLHIATLKGNERTGDNGNAVAIAQQTLEDMRALTVPKLLAKFSTTTLPIDAALNTVAGPTGTTFRPRVQVEELTTVSPDLIKIRVEVAWSDDNANGAGTGSGSAAALDHSISLELIRTVGDGL
ncbi:MAG: prepilin-type N-terminal cleavage/methylation domain-containing protein [Myxococcales bacterium]|nr:prepilin-type N-terminal cleavage/methylation domain-containing protein [Myxococcales bacterium]